MILQKIIARKNEEVAVAKARRPLQIIRAMAEEQEEARSLEQALSTTGTRIIAECKQKSPSAGILRQSYDPIGIALNYQTAGAAAISVLTDTEFFGGSLDDLSKVKSAIRLPVLRKDFVIDPYQIYEARAAGADSVLLIAGVLDLPQLQYFIEISRELMMEPLVESHSPQDLDIALGSDGRILGINCRDLKTFKVDIDHLKALRKRLSGEFSDRILVAESGVKNRDDIEQLSAIGYKAFLIGESLLRSADCGLALRNLLST